MAKRSSKQGRREESENRARDAARAEQVRQVQVRLGYGVVALAVLGGLVMSVWPQAMGLHGSNPAVGVALVILAGFRLLALRAEVRREAQMDGPVAELKPAPRAARTSR